LVGEDGATHHGVFDLAYLRCIPNMTIFAPMNEVELRDMMFTAQLGLDGPIAIRYPRGRGVTLKWQIPFSIIKIGKGKVIKNGSEIAILSIGTIGNMVIEACNNVSDKQHIAHYNMRFVKPLDEDLLHAVFQKFDTIITIEDGTIVGGFGSAVLEFAQEHNYQNKKIKRLGIPDKFIAHGKTDELLTSLSLDVENIKKILSSRA